MILNFGSINIDHVYRVSHLPKPGETLGAHSYDRYLGGKGINQSAAIARAGGTVRHIGSVGPDGDWALTRIQELGIDTSSIGFSTTATGHAIINVDDNGENVIVIYGGANLEFSIEQIERALSAATQGDWVLLQNETNLTEEIAEKAKGKGCKVAYSAAPFVAEKASRILPLVDLLVVNELEAESLSGLLGVGVGQIPVPQLLVTKGGSGAYFRASEWTIEQPAFSVEPLDTTGAGDTYLGSFLARFSENGDPEQAMRYASAASAIQITRPGAAAAIPERDEVEVFLKKQDQ